MLALFLMGKGNNLQAIALPPMIEEPRMERGSGKQEEEDKIVTLEPKEWIASYPDHTGRSNRPGLTRGRKTSFRDGVVSSPNSYAETPTSVGLHLEIAPLG